MRWRYRLNMKALRRVIIEFLARMAVLHQEVNVAVDGLELLDGAIILLLHGFTSTK